MTNTTKPIFVILAGGQSVRMGEDKAFIPIGKNSNFLTQLLNKLNEIDGSIYISLRNEQLEIYKPYTKETTLILDKDLPVEGPLKGILSSYLHLKEKKHLGDFIFFLPIDIPYVEEKTIQRLLETYDSNPKPISGLFYTQESALEPLCGIYSKITLSQWTESLFLPGLHEYSLQKRILSLDPKPIFINLPLEEKISFRNINSKMDLQGFHK
ncbi:molybdenum cofactor guanylyltransferase [Leptospira noumeaensis]|uniref:Probable molybdenum cofactor guanylyltransferase n=1 Tax=Leptospira noumeaensis TaxID=2484964 RepID=A0A4R9I1E7_9LEPT|nr:molybdenum cofactor guanylyltransferase [Leptospira noumeaensis]TGK79151.1 molybdenum cofactor guanylyltransferase [Leptospira noumeaensis]